MSFAKIAESRAVRKIVKMIQDGCYPASPVIASTVAESIVMRIERGDWRDVELPKPKKGKPRGKKKKD
jgi:hypothetical protein